MTINSLFTNRDYALQHIANCSIRNTPERVQVYLSALELYRIKLSFTPKELTAKLYDHLSPATVYNTIVFFRRIGILNDEEEATMFNRKTLPDILKQNESNAMPIEKDEEKYIVVSISSLGKPKTLANAIRSAKIMDEATAIVRVVHVIRPTGKKKYYAIVEDKASKLYHKKVVIGTENKDGMVRCRIDGTKQHDYVHTSKLRRV